MAGLLFSVSAYGADEAKPKKTELASESERPVIEPTQDAIEAAIDGQLNAKVSNGRSGFLGPLSSSNLQE